MFHLAFISFLVPNNKLFKKILKLNILVTFTASTIWVCHVHLVYGQFMAMSILTGMPLGLDFRRVPLGDIDLRREIRGVDDSGVVERSLRRRGVRRMRSAKIRGEKLPMMVALYDRDNAEEHSIRQSPATGVWRLRPFWRVPKYFRTPALAAIIPTRSRDAPHQRFSPIRKEGAAPFAFPLGTYLKYNLPMRY
ncbi:hypothetical protein B0H11DRAFT_1921808 [Mycena galericulata]|nr:hypothetical protein B0H11DRAFT_1921808 [Mycena galericulata]